MAMTVHPYQHVVVVVEENHDLEQIMASWTAPFLQRLSKEGLLFTSYKAVAHPSEPNYFALLSGSTQGIADDCSYSFQVPTLAGQLRQAGYSFAGYAEEGSPRKHNPWESFEDARDFGRDFRQFPAEFDRLPTVSMVVPNLRHDMHDGSVGEGDAWLEAKLGAYAEWVKTHDSLLIVTFDEGPGDSPVPTIVLGEGVNPGETGQRVNHFSLLGLIEYFYGLPKLGRVAQAPRIDMSPEAYSFSQEASGNQLNFLGWIVRTVSLALPIIRLLVDWHKTVFSARRLLRLIQR